MDVYLNQAHIHRITTICNGQRQDLTNDEFAVFQHNLAAHPDAGDLIPRFGGCRKLRWAFEGQGIRGGVRVIYFLRLSSGQIVLVTMYAKNIQDNIDPSE